jgi:PAS domain-containing protein
MMEETTTPLLFNVEDIVETVREPMLVLSANLRMQRANRSFYRSFGVSPDETVNRLVYELGNRQWDISALRELLEHVEEYQLSNRDSRIVNHATSTGYVALNADCVAPFPLGAKTRGVCGRPLLPFRQLARPWR